MRLIFLSLILLCLTPIILNSTCTISYSNSEEISSFDDCKDYTTKSENKVCCYVKGVDTKSNEISACSEFTGTEKGVAKDLYDLEGSIIKKYYLEADCNLGKKFLCVTLMIINLILLFQQIFVKVILVLP